MCGIGGFTLKNDTLPHNRLENLLDDLLWRLDHRGGDACGFAAITSDGEVVSQRAAVGALEFAEGRRSLPKGVVSVICHTRLATQGSAAWPENNHPVSFGGIHLVHNGHIFNDAAIFRRKEVPRFAAVDTACLPVALSRSPAWEAKTLGRSLERVEGSLAIAALNAAHPGDLFLARGAWSPLAIMRTRPLVVFGSEAPGIEQAWKAVVGTTPAKASAYLHEGDTILYRDGSPIERGSFAANDGFPVRTIDYRTTKTGAGKRYNPPGSPTSAELATQILAAHGVEKDDAVFSEDDENENPHIWQPEGITFTQVEQCDYCGELEDKEAMIHIEGWAICPICGDDAIDLLEMGEVIPLRTGLS